MSKTSFVTDAGFKSKLPNAVLTVYCFNICKGVPSNPNPLKSIAPAFFSKSLSLIKPDTLSLINSKNLFLFSCLSSNSSIAFLSISHVKVSSLNVLNMLSNSVLL